MDKYRKRQVVLSYGAQGHAVIPPAREHVELILRLHEVVHGTVVIVPKIIVLPVGYAYAVFEHSAALMEYIREILPHNSSAYGAVLPFLPEGTKKSIGPYYGVRLVYGIIVHEHHVGPALLLPGLYGLDHAPCEASGAAHIFIGYDDEASAAFLF